MKGIGGVDMTGNPLLLLAVMCWLSGVQLVSLGLLGEMSTRLHYHRSGRRPYVVETVWNGEEDEPPRVFGKAA